MKDAVGWTNSIPYERNSRLAKMIKVGGLHRDMLARFCNVHAAAAKVKKRTLRDGNVYPRFNDDSCITRHARTGWHY